MRPRRGRPAPRVRRQAGAGVVALALAIGAAGCLSVERAPTRIETHRGPAFARTPRRVVALPATCASLSGIYGGGRIGSGAPPAGSTEDVRAPGAAADGAATGTTVETVVEDVPSTVGLQAPATGPRSLWSFCQRPELVGLDMTVRASLEWGGLEVVDSERLNATTMAHLATTETERIGDREIRTTTDELRGARFADAPPAFQQEVLRDLRADGVLVTRVWIGAGVGAAHRRTVEVLIRVLDVSGRLVWARRCGEEIGGFASDAEAIQRAGRCAARGVAR